MPKIKVQAWCPALHPKYNEEDMEKLQNLYADIYNRLEGLEFPLSEAECVKMIITVEARDEQVAQ